MLQCIKCYNVLNVTSNEMLQSTKELSGSKIETFCPCSASRNFYGSSKAEQGKIAYLVEQDKLWPVQVMVILGYVSLGYGQSRQ